MCKFINWRFYLVLQILLVFVSTLTYFYDNNPLGEEMMLSKKLRILNFDDSIVGQKSVCKKYLPHIIELQDIGRTCRLWINQRTRQRLKSVLDPKEKNAITFLGSGDFHHISSLLIEQFDKDFCVIIFDLHPDLDFLPPRFSCGSWVNLIAAQRTVKKIVMLGPSSDDLTFPNNMTFNFSWFNNARVEIYPYNHAPSRMLFKNLEKNNFIHTHSKSFFQTITWENLINKDIKAVIADIMERLPTKNIYISIDKDCLSWDHAVTNWEPGMMSLDWLLDALRALKDGATIVGMDIAGDYSPIDVKSLVKKICINWDHPRQLAEALPVQKVNEINEITNLKILELFL
jgi:arginase family enzyme